MRAAIFVVLLAGCSNDVAVDAADARPPLPNERCTSPVGSAAITASGENLESRYERMYAGGFIPGSADSGGGYHGFDLRLIFRNAALEQSQIYPCYDAMNCDDGGFVVDASLAEGDELGVHAATFRSTTNSWSATGTITVTAFEAPGEYLGHLAGSLAADSSVTIDGTFDHSFCLDFISAVL